MNNKTNNVNNEKKNVVSNIANGQMSAKEIWAQKMKEYQSAFEENKINHTSNKGEGRESIYNKFAIEFEIEKGKAKNNQTARRSLRNKCFKKLSDIITYFEKNNEAVLKTYINEFNKFYLCTYNVTDYSVSSVAAGQRDEKEKQILEKGMRIVREFNEKNN